MSTGNKVCGYCGEEILEYLGRCPFCGSILEKENKEPIADNGSYNMPSAEIPLKPLSNGLKVFLTVVCTVIPGLGQLAGIIASILFMNAYHDPDRRSFGKALMIASVILFVLSFFGYLVILLGIYITRTRMGW